MCGVIVTFNDCIKGHENGRHSSYYMDIAIYFLYRLSFGFWVWYVEKTNTKELRSMNISQNIETQIVLYIGRLIFWAI